MARSAQRKGGVAVVIKGVPFYANTSDGTHCFQAVLKMILGYFWPDKTYSWQELDKISAKEEGLWTWPMAGELWLQNHGFAVRAVTLFDYSRFAQEGENYMIAKNGEEVARIQIAHSNIPKEQQIAKEFLAKATVKKRPATFEEARRLLDEGWLVICNVNSRRLNGREGFVGHFVLLVGHEDGTVIFHDPGGNTTKGTAFRKTTQSLFQKAWADPSENECELVAVKLAK